MTGQFARGDKEAPGHIQMAEEQTLVAPHGFVWSMRVARGAMRVSRSDGVEAVDGSMARVTDAHDGLSQSIDVTVGAD